jgi:hypothetical protein
MTTPESNSPDEKGDPPEVPPAAPAYATPPPEGVPDADND